jgi:hypothetical protein
MTDFDDVLIMDSTVEFQSIWEHGGFDGGEPSGVCRTASWRALISRPAV